MYKNDLMSNLILNILAGMVLIVFVGVIYAIAYAIIMFIFSGGDEAKIKKAWNSIRYSLLGFILTLIILFAVPGILRTLHVPGYKLYTSTNIFKTSKLWLNRIIGVFDQKKGNTVPNDITPNGNYNL